jgi:hypothetical protein
VCGCNIFLLNHHGEERKRTGEGGCLLSAKNLAPKIAFISLPISTKNKEEVAF